jgi:hypothetical protein
MFRQWIRGIGIVIALVGGLSFKFTPGINPERDLSVFHNLADLGLFIEYGFILVVVGTVLILLSFLMPTSDD